MDAALTEAAGRSVASRVASVGATDAELLEAAKSGSVEAAGHLAGRYWDQAHRAALLIVGDERIAEDLAQESILTALRSLETFDPSRPFAPWLHRIVTNTTLDWLRSPASRDVPVDPESLSEESVHPTTDPGLAAALQQLSPEDRAAVVLRYVLGYMAAEVAEMLGVPEGTLRSRLHRALTRLRADLEGDGQ